MAEISLDHVGGDTYRVTVSERGARTTHDVEVTPDMVERFAAGRRAEELLAASFRFLLDREPKESILGRFELPVIERYFSDYPDRIGDYL